jgi:hypothetical protein
MTLQLNSQENGKKKSELKLTTANLIKKKTINKKAVSTFVKI